MFPSILKVLAGPVRVELTSPGSEPGALPLGHGPADFLVAPPGIEPGVAVCNTAALPLGHGAMLAESTPIPSGQARYGYPISPDRIGELTRPCRTLLAGYLGWARGC